MSEFDRGKIFDPVGMCLPDQPGVSGVRHESVTVPRMVRDYIVWMQDRLDKAQSIAMENARKWGEMEEERDRAEARLAEMREAVREEADVVMADFDTPTTTAARLRAIVDRSES